MPMSRSFLPTAQDLRTCVRKFLRSSSDPIAEPPPVGPHTGATSEPMTRLREATLSARRLRSSSLESISVCGRDRKMSTPSKRWPSTSAAAVRSSIVSRSITGSASGPPLPTSPGQVALCSFGYWYFFSALIDLLLGIPGYARFQRAGVMRDYFHRSLDSPHLCTLEACVPRGFSLFRSVANDMEYFIVMLDWVEQRQPVRA